MNSTHSAPSHKTACLLGCGKMGSAMLRSWIADDVFSTIFVIDPSPIASDLLDHPCVKYFSTFPEQHISEIDILILAVKPQILKNSLQDLAKSIPDDVLIISIAAGQSLSTLSSILGHARPIVRTMPNTPAAIGKSMSVAIGADCVSQTQKELTFDILSSVGAVEWVNDETLMDAVTAVSGSGPAYVFYLIEALAQAGVNSGLSHDLAMRLARQTVIGSAALAEKEAYLTAATLRENVTSPNGTTEAALDVLMNGDFQTILDKAINAAKERSIELNT